MRLVPQTRTSYVIALVIALCFVSFPAYAKYSGGTGEPNDPYQIATAADLIALSETPEDYDKHFLLTADIDLDPNLPGRKVFDRAVIAPDTNEATSWFEGTAFSGVFDGSGHTISHLTVRGRRYLGLFGQLEPGAEVRNLGVIDVNVAGSADFGNRVGSGDYVGGLVADNSGHVTSCYATGSVGGENSLSFIGGLVGVNSGGLTSCYASVSVSGYASAVGGLVGRNYQGSLTACYAKGLVSAPTGRVGGAAGENIRGSFTGCFWDIETSNRLNSDGGKGLSTSQMKSLLIYQNAGWAGKGWVIDDGQDYPHLACENTGGVPIPDAKPVPLLGSGTTEDPYQVWSPADFALLSWHSRVLDKHIALMADIDLQGTTLYPVGDLGPFTGVFDGNGRIIRNADVNMPDGDYVGLFAYLGTNGQIRNLRAEDLIVTGKSYVGALVAYVYRGSLMGCSVNGLVGAVGTPVGGLVGRDDYGSIDMCCTNANVSGNSSVGGIVGSDHNGSLTACHATGSVEGGWLGSNIGGLVGDTEYGTIDTCYATGRVNGKTSVGGLVGHITAGSFTFCHATGPVAGDSYVGGLAGANRFGGSSVSYTERKDSILTACYATGSVKGNDTVGGLVGSNSGGDSWSGNAIITDCYSTGSVSGGDNVGGLVGSNEGSIETCYASGSVSGNERIGGLVGITSAGRSGDWVVGCFWDVETSGCATSAGGMGKSTAEMKDVWTYQGAGWDFTSQDSDPPDWVMPANDYPLLAWAYVKQAARSEIPVVTGMNWQEAGGVIDAARFVRAGISWIPSETVRPGDVVEQVPAAGSEGIEGYTGISLTISCGNRFSEGSGTEDDPYQVSTVAEWMLLTVRPGYWDKHVALVADLDMLGLLLPPVAESTRPFSGFLYGGGHVIRNAVIRQGNASNTGLFGYLENGKIENLGVANVQVNGAAYTGGLVGLNSGGTISGCYTDGNVTGNTPIIGGLVGSNADGTISNCYSRCSVTGYYESTRERRRPAGLVGINSGIVSYCYATGTVGAPGAAPGLACGLVGEAVGGRIRSSFWDIETSGQIASAGGTGKTTAEMKMQSTFTQAGWDFVGETAHGTEDIWWIDEGQDYPRLWWESIPEN